jgi:sulfatase modifying factor 1
VSRVARSLVLALLVAPGVSSAGCGGEGFTTAPEADHDAAADASTPSTGDASTQPATGGDAEAGVEAGSPLDAHPDASEASVAPTGCPTGRGPVMVAVGSFCIDGTEVTSAQYNDFLLTGPPATGQPSVCSWNTSYLPGNGWTFSPAEGTLPIANVNWCDAYAFCKWAGKRLCGKVGGGAADFSSFASPDNEHYVACSNNSTRVYPYGNTFSSTACNGVERDAGHVVAVGSLSGCQGGVPGLFDMSGNVEEWQDSCDGNSGPNDACLDGSGAFDFGNPPDGTRCDFADSDARNGQLPDVGIRCCASLP